MDQRGDRKRAREGEQEPPAAALKMAAGRGEGAWRRPAWVFDLPWQKCRGGLGVAGDGGVGWELHDVFFCSLVDGRAAAIGVPGDRQSPPPSNRSLFDELDAWLAAAGDGEVDPLWRSVLEGPSPSKPAA